MKILRFGIIFVAAMALTLLSGCLPVAEPPMREFSFVHISDSHAGSGNASAKLDTVLKVVHTKYPATSFIVNTGDLTDWGLENEWEEYRAVVEKSRIPVYQVNGNHDARWSDNGKNYFIDAFGATYYAFQNQGVWFLMLDSSLLLEQYGYISPDQLDWLRQQLAKIGKTAPVVIGFHHPPFLDKVFVANEHDFLNTIRPYNVILVLTGHGHSRRHWQVNGIDFLMTDGTMDRDFSFLNIGIRQDSLTVSEYDILDSLPTVFLRKSIVPKSKSVAMQIVHQHNSDGDHLFQFNGLSAGKTYFFRIDRGRRIAVQNSGTNSRIEIAADSLASGLHRITLEKQLAGADNRVEISSRTFINKYFPEKIYQTEGMIIAAPVVSGDTVFVVSMTGELAAVNLATGTEFWKRQFPRGIVASPVYSGGRLFVSCLDGNLYALSAKDGNTQWQFRGGKAFYARPLIEQGTVYLGNGDGNMYAIALADGIERWRFATGKLIKNRAVYHDGRLFFGGWDLKLHALDAHTGAEIWEYVVHQNRYFAAATSDPVIADSILIIASHDHVTRALRLSDGKENWRLSEQDFARTGYSSPVLLGNQVIYSSLSGHVFAADTADGSIEWIQQVTGDGDAVFDSSPVESNGRIWVGSIGGNAAWVSTNGDRYGRIRLGDSYIFARVCAINGGVLITGLDGQIYYASDENLSKSSLH